MNSELIYNKNPNTSEYNPSEFKYKNLSSAFDSNLETFSKFKKNKQLNSIENREEVNTNLVNFCKENIAKKSTLHKTISLASSLNQNDLYKDLPTSNLQSNNNQDKHKKIKVQISNKQTVNDITKVFSTKGLQIYNVNEKSHWDQSNDFSDVSFKVRADNETDFNNIQHAKYELKQNGMKILKEMKSPNNDQAKYKIKINLLETNYFLLITLGIMKKLFNSGETKLWTH